MIFSEVWGKRRLSSTVNTTGTFDVHRCFGIPNSSSDEVGKSEDQGITVLRLSANKENVLGHLKDSLSTDSSLGTCKPEASWSLLGDIWKKMKHQVSLIQQGLYGFNHLFGYESVRIKPKVSKGSGGTINNR
jgi:hypothetical protein